MRYRSGQSGSGRIGSFVLFAFIGLAIFGRLDLFIPLFIVIAFCSWALRLNRRMSDDIPSYSGVRSRTVEPASWRPVQQSGPQHIAAERALQRAGQSIINTQAQLSDIGLLVYKGTNEPEIIRLGDVPTNATHVRPFVVFDLSAAAVASAAGTIRFNLIDGDGNFRYTVRSRYTLKHGVNFITPPTWLPLKDQNAGGVWSLQINVGDGDPIAIHEFRWLAVGGELRAALTGDGEIDEVMKDVIEQHTAADETMSLDELLGEQGEIAPAMMQAKH